MRLSALLAALPQPPALPATDPEIAAVTADSRQVTPGALFVAVRGESADGHRFIPQALRRGAVAVVGERGTEELGELEEFRERGEPGPSVPAFPIAPFPYITVSDSRLALAWLAAAFHGFPARQMAMIGITGTDGKTTTANLLHSILAHAGLRAGLITTVNAVIGDEVLETGLHTTTPDAPDVQAYLARMARAGLTHAILEATSHGLAQDRVAACDFDIAILTNITHEHLDYHGTREAYRAAKARLFEGLAVATRKPGQEKVAVLNRGDASYDYLRQRTAARVVSYNAGGETEDSAGADVTVRNVQATPQGMRFEVVHGNLAFPVEMPLSGRFNVSNCLAAIAGALVGLRVGPNEIQAGISAVGGIPGRLERIDMGQPFTAVVDFAHTPNALARALESVRQMAAGRVIAVFGSAGLRDRAKRRLMPETSTRLADLTVLTAEDPRTESLDAILAEMAAACAGAGGVEGRNFWRVPDRGQALRFAVGLARPGDVVIACGKGHEQSMCFGTVEFPWDDRTALRAALAEYLGRPGPEMPRLPTGTG